MIDRYFVYALAYWWGSRQVRSGEYSVLQFFVVLPALLFSAQACGQMFSLAPEFTKVIAAALNVFSLHDQRPSFELVHSNSDEILGMAEEKVLSSSSIPPEKKKHECARIEFSHVDLTYSTRPSAPAFTDLSFSIEPGDFVALVGPSGAGKSSVITLIERFIDRTSRSICVDNIYIRKLSL
jgi:ATP-binding cassette, subfamily B (MDR/TAP), member 1